MRLGHFFGAGGGRPERSFCGWFDFPWEFYGGTKKLLASTRVSNHPFSGAFAVSFREGRGLYMQHSYMGI